MRKLVTHEEQLGIGDRHHRDALYRRRRRSAEEGDAASKIYNSQRWRKYRHWFIVHHPFCEDPFNLHAAENMKELTGTLHHRVKVNERPDLAFTDSNIQPLCEKCHIHVERGTKPTVIYVRPVKNG